MGLPPSPGTNPPVNPDTADQARGKPMAIKDGMALAIAGYPPSAETLAAAANPASSDVPIGKQRIVMFAMAYAAGINSMATLYATHTATGETHRISLPTQIDATAASYTQLRWPIRLREGWHIDAADDAGVGNIDLTVWYVDVTP